MKRSEINEFIQDAIDFIEGKGFYLPPFAHWKLADWQSKGEEIREIIDNQLGWGLTDFGTGNYKEYGLFMITIRNGHPDNVKTGQGKTYCEKILLSDENQITPLHTHWVKDEDIINRGGGNLVIQLYMANEDGSLSDEDITISLDGVTKTVKAGDTVTLKPGDSIYLPTGLYHKFWGEGGRVMVGEVSLVNDDTSDNRLYDPIDSWFPEIEEDVPPTYLLCSDYAKFTNLV
ncbi:MAG: D-lyxose/D-mannose family sugar isomerase [Anaerolineales bacterium]|nr:D-lyxose/D-mannose family sugar isomerase [Anaerolineales bacterium]